MRKILSCEFNMDTACVELDWLIYNDPLAYAELILNGDQELYLEAVTKKTLLD